MKMAASAEMTVLVEPYYTRVLETEAALEVYNVAEDLVDQYQTNLIAQACIIHVTDWIAD
jgi:hypothetical protein